MDVTSVENEVVQENQSMLDVLHQVESQLQRLLKSSEEKHWNSLFVDYHPPFVERLWTQSSDCRIYLHRIHPCEPGEALFHTHPWPSAMRVLEGSYELAVGYGAGEKEPPVAARMILGPGSEYEMTDPNGWHFVRPIEKPTMSLMVAGRPWDRSSPKSDKPLKSLPLERQQEIFQFFRKHYLN